MIYSQVSAKFRREFYSLTAASQSILISAHKSPDDDSIASVLTMYLSLRQKYPQKRIRIAYSSDETKKWSYFLGFNSIIFTDDIATRIEDADLFILLDAGQYRRATENPEALKKIAKKVCLDHHSSPPDDFDLSLISPLATSTPELTFELINKDTRIDRRLAEIILLGITGDTGNFCFVKPNQTKIFSIAKKLVEIGQIEIQDLQSKYRTISQKEFIILQELIKNTRYAKVSNWPDFQYALVDQSFVKEGNYSDNEISEATTLYAALYIRTIEGYTWGFVISPRTGGFRISLRSLPGSVSVRRVMETMGIGGGHDRAAGGNFSAKVGESAKDQVEKLVRWLEKNPPILV